METTTERPQTKGDLIEQVVAWHNRHPLACRIDESQVHGVGIVALPFAQQVTGKRPKPLFSTVIDAIRPDSIASLAWRDGSDEPPGNDDWPRRDIPVDPGQTDATAQIRFLRTAAIEIGSRRIRVLIGKGGRPRMLGRRFWHRQRAIVLLVGISLLIIGGAAGHWWAAEPITTSLAAVEPAPAPALGPPPPTRSDTAPVLPVVEPAAAAASDASGVPTDPAATGPSVPEDIEASDAAASEPADDKVAEPESTTAPNETIPPPPTATDSPVRTADATTAPAAEEVEVFALATGSTNSRLASELRISLMNLPTTTEADSPRAEVMQVGKRWRVVIWPFASRVAAESLRSGLAERGLKTELIGF